MGWLDTLLKVGGAAAAPFTGGASLALTGAGGVLGGMGKGAADERTNVNAFNQNADRTRTSQYTTQQGALLNALLASGRDKMQGYDTKQGATLQSLSGLQNATSGALANQSAEKLALARLGMEAPNIAAKQSVLGSLMKNLQPHSFTSPVGQQGHLTKVSGGLSPTALDPMTRQHGELLMKGALERQLSGNNVPAPTDFMSGIQDWKSGVLDVPEATDYSKGVLTPPELTDYKKAGKGESILSGLGGALGLIGAVGGAFGNKGGGDGGDYTERTPSYDVGSKTDRYGNPIGYQLPRGVLGRPLEELANEDDE